MVAVEEVVEAVVLIDLERLPFLLLSGDGEVLKLDGEGCSGVEACTAQC